MKVFSVIDDALPIVRHKNGVFKQVQLYYRGDRVYVKHGSGFVEVRYEQPDGTLCTSMPDLTVVDYDSFPGLRKVKHTGVNYMRRP